MYGYMADLATEPRWYRIRETFGEDSELVSQIMEALVQGLQGGAISPDTAVALTLKHFPGGGPQELGLDPHYSFGKRQIYPTDSFDAHVAPFRRAISAGLNSVMPYYGVPVDLEYEGIRFDEIGFAFSPQATETLLRDRLGFTGYVNSDTGIVQSRAWGLEDQPVAARVAATINAGTDVISGFSNVTQITELVDAGLVSDARLTEAARRLLTEQFALGLFENPYVDAQAATGIIANDAHLAKAAEVQRQSIVLLQNDGLLPLAAGQSVYALNFAPAQTNGIALTVGNLDEGAERVSAAGHDAAVIRVNIRNRGTGDYRSNDPGFGSNPDRLNPATGKIWAAEDGCNIAPGQNPVCADDGKMGGPQSPALGLLFGGAFPWETDALSFTEMAKAESWNIYPGLDVIQAVMAEVGAENTIIAVDFRNPYVIDTQSGLRGAGALLATFGANDAALLDIVTGEFAPVGKMPFALAENLQAVISNQSDAPGYPDADTLFPFGHGLTYEEK